MLYYSGSQWYNNFHIQKDENESENYENKPLRSSDINIYIFLMGFQIFNLSTRSVLYLAPSIIPCKLDLR